VTLSYAAFIQVVIVMVMCGDRIDEREQREH